jgi:hypothetical protein
MIFWPNKKNALAGIATHQRALQKFALLGQF